MVTRGYLDTPALFDCPTPMNMTTRNWGGGPVVFTNTTVTPNIADFGQDKQLQFAEYGYDLGRVSRNSVAGRVFYGDLLERNHQWGPSWGHWDYNHRDGSNVLHVDQAVEWAAIQDEYLTDNSGNYLSLWDGDGWARQGWIPNPRMDEDIHRYQVYEDLGLVTKEAELMYPMDHDDVYLIEGWSSGGTVDPFRWSYIGDPTMRDGCRPYPNPSITTLNK